MAHTILNIEIRSKAEHFTGTDSFSRDQFLRVFKKIAPELGVSTTCGYLLCTFFEYSHRDDWKHGRPIVWPSNDELLNCVGGSLRQLQNNIKKLIDLGLIVRVISAEGRRYGRRDNEGRIIEAYGFDLSPLAFRYFEFMDLLKNKEKNTAKRKTLKKGITRIFKNINEIMENTKTCVDEIVDSAKKLYSNSRRQRNVATLEVDFNSINALYDQLKKRLEDAQIIIPALYTPPITSQGATECIGNTINEFITKNVYVDKGQLEDDLGKNGSYQEDTSQCEFTELVERYQVKPIHILMFCTIFKQYVPKDTNLRWIHIANAAEDLYKSIGISKNQWWKAKGAIGPYGASILVAVILAKSKEIKSPCKYLNSLLNRAIMGTLNLGPTVMGLLKSCDEYDEKRRQRIKNDSIEYLKYGISEENGLQKSTREMTLEEDLNDLSWADTAAIPLLDLDTGWVVE